MISNLPDELWSQIFDIAADEDILFQHGFPTVMAESAWYKDHIVDTWRLRSPQEAMNVLQRRSYATKKAIISTCRQWRSVGSEFLFRCLHFSDPSKIVSLCSILDTSASSTNTITSSYGWWTRRIHLARYHPSDSKGMTWKDLENALVTIIRDCPNLEIFVVERPMGGAFGPVADALATYASRKLHTVQWNVPGESLSKVIWALNALPRLIATHIDIESPVPSAQEYANLGSASNLPLKLPLLQQLSLRGYVEELVEQAAGWELPSLRSFSVDSGSSVHDVPDVVEFVRNHGLQLLLLDLNCAPILATATILDLCPNLITLTFNADWRITPHDEIASEVTNHPHANITTIGLHGLSSAFGVGLSAASGTIPIEQVRMKMVQKSNDLNMAALNRRNFPKLMRIRALSRTMLNDLNRADGPSNANGGFDRWNKWWDASVKNHLTLEDCTGHTLGTLPQDEAEESESDDDEEEEDEEEEEEGEEGEEDDEEEEDDDDDEWGSQLEEEEELAYNVHPLPEGNGRTMELTRLLQECRAMNEGRDEDLISRIRIPRPDSPL